MARILMVYTSIYGHTQKLAEELAQSLGESGHVVTLANTKTHREPKLAGYDAVIVGAPVYRARFPRSTRKWLYGHARELSGKPSAFFSVCLGVLEKDHGAVLAQERRIVSDLLVSVGWRPTITQILPGALPYTRYGWITRALMKRISSQAGGDTDTSRDYDYTDRAELGRFAQEFSRVVQRRADAKRTLPLSPGSNEVLSV